VKYASCYVRVPHAVLIRLVSLWHGGGVAHQRVASLAMLSATAMSLLGISISLSTPAATAHAAQLLLIWSSCSQQGGINMHMQQLLMLV
jgi:hypothetical protein